MKPKNSKLHVLIGAKNKVLSVYEAPPQDRSANGGEVVPMKGQRVIEVEVAATYKDLKSVKEVLDLVKPHIKTATLVRRGTSAKPSIR